jgi:hypothetical protein
MAGRAAIFWSEVGPARPVGAGMDDLRARRPHAAKARAGWDAVGTADCRRDQRTDSPGASLAGSPPKRGGARCCAPPPPAKTGSRRANNGWSGYAKRRTVPTGMKALELPVAGGRARAHVRRGVGPRRPRADAVASEHQFPHATAGRASEALRGELTCLDIETSASPGVQRGSTEVGGLPGGP